MKHWNIVIHMKLIVLHQTSFERVNFCFSLQSLELLQLRLVERQGFNDFYFQKLEWKMFTRKKQLWSEEFNYMYTIELHITDESY